MEWLQLYSLDRWTIFEVQILREVSAFEFRAFLHRNFARGSAKVRKRSAGNKTLCIGRSSPFPRAKSHLAAWFSVSQEFLQLPLFLRRKKRTNEK